MPLPPDTQDMLELTRRMDNVVNRLEKIEKDRELLIRMDERQTTLFKSITDWKDEYVSKAEFEPIKRFVYGAIGLALASIGGTIISLSLHK